MSHNNMFGGKPAYMGGQFHQNGGTSYGTPAFSNSHQGSASNPHQKYNELVSFFGQPTVPFNPNMLRDLNDRNMWTLLDYWRGSNTFISTRILEGIESIPSFWTTDLLPAQYDVPEGGEIQWEELVFNNHTLDPVPFLGISRLTTKRLNQTRFGLKRYGLAFQMEHGFLLTPTGKEHYVASITQIAAACHRTWQLNAAYEIVHSAYNSSGGRISLGPYFREHNIEQIIDAEVQYFGAVNKNEFGFDKCKMQAKQALVANGARPDSIVIGEQLEDFIKCFRPETRQWFQNGPGYGLKESLHSDYGWVEQHKSSGEKVYHAKPFNVGHHRKPENILEAVRTNGEFAHFGDAYILEAVLGNQTTTPINMVAARRFRALDYDKDDFVTLSWTSLLSKSGLFDQSGSLTPELGRAFFTNKGIFTVGDLVDKQTRPRRNAFLKTLAYEAVRDSVAHVTNGPLARVANSTDIAAMSPTPRHTIKRRKTNHQHGGFFSRGDAANPAAAANVESVNHADRAENQAGSRPNKLAELSRVADMPENIIDCAHVKTCQSTSSKAVLDVYTRAFENYTQSLHEQVVQDAAKESITEENRAEWVLGTNWFNDQDELNDNLHNEFVDSDAAPAAKVLFAKLVLALSSDIDDMTFVLDELSKGKCIWHLTQSNAASSAYMVKRAIDFVGAQDEENGQIDDRTDTWGPDIERAFGEVVAITFTRGHTQALSLDATAETMLQDTKNACPTDFVQYNAMKKSLNNQWTKCEDWASGLVQNFLSACVIVAASSENENTMLIQDINTVWNNMKLTELFSGIEHNLPSNWNESFTNRQSLALALLQYMSVRVHTWMTDIVCLKTLTPNENFETKFEGCVKEIRDQYDGKNVTAETLRSDKNELIKGCQDARVQENDGAKSVVDKVRALQIHRDVLVALHEAGVFVPINFIIARPHVSYLCESAVVMQRGEQTGRAYLAKGDFQFASDAGIKDLFGHYTVLLRCKVFKPKNIFVMHNIWVKDYHKGTGSLRLWDASNPSDVAAYRQGSRKCAAFAMAVPASHELDQVFFDVNGRLPASLLGLADQLDHGPSYKYTNMYPNAGLYSKLWGWSLSNANSYLQGGFCAHAPTDPVANTLCLQMTHFLPSIESNGHIGKDAWCSVRSKSSWWQSPSPGMVATICGRGEGGTGHIDTINYAADYKWKPLSLSHTYS